ncbi:MAG TPA: hypothetical protein VGR00_10270, partial [Thermoanaerobaculia bacterium]|nr:hypothetical protein [Thermoanaerobaculia bacterium]
ANDWDPACMRSWLEDVSGSGTYSFTATLPEGSFECKVAIDESFSENYGAGGVPNGSNIAFSVPSGGALVFFTYDAATHVLTVCPDAEGPAVGAPSPVAVTQSDCQ